MIYVGSVASESDKIPNRKHWYSVPLAVLLSNLVYSKAKRGHLGLLLLPFIPPKMIANDGVRGNN